MRALADKNYTLLKTNLAIPFAGKNGRGNLLKAKRDRPGNGNTHATV